MAAWTYWWAGFRALVDRPEDAFRRAERAAERALSDDDPSGFATLVMAHLHLQRGDHEQALECRPSCDASAAAVASILNYLDRADEAIEFAEQAVRLTPLVPTIYPGILSTAYYGSSRYHDAVAAAQAILELDPDAIDAWLMLAAAQAAAGNASAAGEAVSQVLRLKPGLTRGTYLDTQPYMSVARLDSLDEHLRIAGLP